MHWKYRGLYALGMVYLVREVSGQRIAFDKEAVILKGTLTFIDSTLCPPWSDAEARG